ncbi:protein tweety-like [Melanaphis sacchari]|uniref:protein tweety-like n=1 Tax=Melanaphis sacchari TaxID=742174 RepID=UPI000DC155F4|nr:protein tweety-like [Melanaphis sacchari]
MEQFWHGLLIGCIFTVTVCSSEDTIPRRVVPNSDEYQDEIVAAEDHEHHRIIIVVPKEVPQHVNHVHTYKLAGKGIPLIHSGKVVHDHKHSGKVAHEHGHVGKSAHSHKHAGAYGHQHKHIGYVGHKHFGKVGVAGHKLVKQPPFDHHRQNMLLHNAAHQLHLQHQQQLLQTGDYLVQQHGAAGGSSGVLQAGGRRPASGGRIQFVPSSKPRGLGSFMPAEIQQFVQHNAVVQHQQHQQQQQRNQHQHQQQQQLQHQQHQHQQQQQQQYADYDDDESGGGRSASPPAYNVIHLRVPDHQEPNVIKHVDIDLVNNVAKLQTSEKHQPVTANFKSVTQYNKVIGHGRAVAAANAEDEFDAQTDDEDVGGELLLEDVGYRFGEGYKLAMDTSGGLGAHEFSSAQEQDEEEADESFKEPSGDEPSDGGGGGGGGSGGGGSNNNAYSQMYSLQF